MDRSILPWLSVMYLNSSTERYLSCAGSSLTKVNQTRHQTAADVPVVDVKYKIILNNQPPELALIPERHTEDVEYPRPAHFLSHNTTRCHDDERTHVATGEGDAQQLGRLLGRRPVAPELRRCRR